MAQVPELLAESLAEPGTFDSVDEFMRHLDDAMRSKEKSP